MRLPPNLWYPGAIHSPTGCAMGVPHSGIVMPHTIVGNYRALRRHPRMMIVCREPETYARLLGNGMERRQTAGRSGN